MQPERTLGFPTDRRARVYHQGHRQGEGETETAEREREVDDELVRRAIRMERTFGVRLGLDGGVKEYIAVYRTISHDAQRSLRT